MTPDQIRVITRDRFTHWAETLVRVHATPILAVAVGHDEVVGAITICIPDTFTIQKDEILLLLRRAIEMLESS